MKSITVLKPGDIVSVEFPFSDLQTRKRRPGLVLISDEHDLLVARITTHSKRDAFDVALQSWSGSGLPRASTVRLAKLATIDHRLVHHKLGELHRDDGQAIAEVWQRMANAFAASFPRS